MSGEVVRNVFRPPRYVDAQWNRMMLDDDEATFCCSLDLRVIGKDPRPGDDHVALEPEDCFEDVVPHAERDAGALGFRSWNPAAEQVLVADKQASIFDDRARIHFCEIRRQCDE